GRRGPPGAGNLLGPAAEAAARLGREQAAGRGFLRRRAMSALRRLRGALASGVQYLWSGWGAIASLLLFCALWELGGQVYGELVLPGPMATLRQLAAMFSSGMAAPE